MHSLRRGLGRDGMSRCEISSKRNKVRGEKMKADEGRGGLSLNVLEGRGIDV